MNSVEALSFRLHMRRASAAYSPWAQERGLTFVIRMCRFCHPAHSHLQDTWRAWVRRDCVASSGCALQRPDMGMGIAGFQSAVRGHGCCLYAAALHIHT